MSLKDGPKVKVATPFVTIRNQVMSKTKSFYDTEDEAIEAQNKNPGPTPPSIDLGTPIQENSNSEPTKQKYYAPGPGNHELSFSLFPVKRRSKPWPKLHHPHVVVEASVPEGMIVESSEFNEWVNKEVDRIMKGLWEQAGIYGQAQIELPAGLGLDDFEHVSITPKLIETVKSGSRRAGELIKQKAALTSKALSQWLGQLDIEMGNQYRYRCMCPSPKCRKAVEFFSYKDPNVINLNDVPKCEVCNDK